VTFEIDANGIVNCSAQDKMTGLEQAMQVTPSSGLSPEEIERLMAEAESSVEKDRAEREMITNRIRLENMLKNARKAMAEYGRAFSPEEQQEINTILSNAEGALSSNDRSELEQMLAKVEETSSRITASMLIPI
jgi:molecular chaperone DnaK